MCGRKWLGASPLCCYTWCNLTKQAVNRFRDKGRDWPEEFSVTDASGGDFQPQNGRSRATKSRRRNRSQRQAGVSTRPHEGKSATAPDSGQPTVEFGRAGNVPVDPMNRLQLRMAVSCRPSAPGDGVDDPSEHGTGPTKKTDARSRPPGKRRRNRRRRRRNDVGDGQLRHMRSPIKPAPVARLIDSNREITGFGGTTHSDSARPNPGANAYRRRNAKGPFYAALDLGTNNCRLLIAVPTKFGQFKVVDAFSRIVRLGEGVSRSGELSAPAMERALEALQICSTKLNAKPIARCRLIATEACRQASNGNAFLERVKQETGLALEIVDRRTEAHLAADGCGSLVDRQASAVVLFDIGGGSSEVALLDLNLRHGRAMSKRIVEWASLPVGVVNFSERHGGYEMTGEIFDRMVGEVASMLAEVAANQKFRHLWEQGRSHLLGTSGTVTTIAGLHFNLERYDRRKIDGCWLNDDDIDGVIKRLIGMTFEERANNPCVGRDRADLVLAGCAIFQAIRQVWPSPWVRVADRGLREGILTQLMFRDRVWQSTRRRTR